MKFNRRYRILIETNDGGTLTVENPISLEATISRSTLSAANSGMFTIYNLSEKNRARILKNKFDGTVLREIQFFAGYGNNLTLCFRGNIQEAFSIRQGTEFVTQITCFDGGYAFSNAEVNRTYSANTSRLAVIEDLVSSLKEFGVERGAIGAISGSLNRSNSYSGNAVKILQEITNNNFYIDNQRAYVVGDDEAVQNPLRVISPETGLIGTPRREESMLVLETLFTPELQVGQIIQLNSKVAKTYNGQLKVVGLVHQGLFSETVGGRVTTKVTLFFGAGSFNVIQGQG